MCVISSGELKCQLLPEFGVCTAVLKWPRKHAFLNERFLELSLQHVLSSAEDSLANAISKLHNFILLSGGSNDGSVARRRDTSCRPVSRDCCCHHCSLSCCWQIVPCHSDSPGGLISAHSLHVGEDVAATPPERSHGVPEGRFARCVAIGRGDAADLENSSTNLSDKACIYKTYY